MAAVTPGASIVEVVGTGLVGTTVEWYDCFLYGSAAAPETARSGLTPDRAAQRRHAGARR